VLTSEIEVREINPVYQFGGHWQTRVGDVLRFGRPWSTSHQVNTLPAARAACCGGASRTPELQVPTELRVRVKDDSPDTREAGAVVYGIYLELEGQDDQGLSSDPDDPRFDPGLSPQVLGGRGGRVSRGAGRGDHRVRLRGAGDDHPAGGPGAAVVANDYRLETAQQHPFFVPLLDRFEPRTTPYQTVAGRRARCGTSPTAGGALPLRADQRPDPVRLRLRGDPGGAEAQGEYERNLLYRSFPAKGGWQGQEQTSGW